MKNSHKSQIIFGKHSIIESIEAGTTLNRVFLDRSIKKNAIELLQLLRDREISYTFVPKEKLDRMTKKNHQGVVASVSPINFSNYEDALQLVFENGKVPLILILDGVSDIGNIGGIIRSAECLGVDFLLIDKNCTINEGCMHASAGALAKMTICKSQNIIDTVLYLKKSGISIVSCTEKAERTLKSFDFNNPIAIIVGGEQAGISSSLLDLSDHQAKIPMIGSISSLNVSVSAGIILYEAFIQRRKEKNE